MNVRDPSRTSGKPMNMSIARKAAKRPAVNQAVASVEITRQDWVCEAPFMLDKA